MPSAAGQVIAVAGRAAQAVAAVATAGGQQLQPHQPSEQQLQLQQSQGRQLAAPRPRTLSSRTVQYVLPAALSHFGPSIGVAVIDNLFGAMTGSKALVLAQQKLTWMTLASKYSAPVGAALGLFVGNQLATVIDRLAARFGVQKIDGTAVALFCALVCYILRPR